MKGGGSSAAWPVGIVAKGVAAPFGPVKRGGGSVVWPGGSVARGAAALYGGGGVTRLPSGRPHGAACFLLLAEALTKGGQDLGSYSCAQVMVSPWLRAGWSLTGTRGFPLWAERC